MPPNTTPYDRLTPDTILDAIESVGFLVDGRMLALNSYENRVYQIGIEEDKPLIAKFYRPGRWSDAHILSCVAAVPLGWVSGAGCSGSEFLRQVLPALFLRTAAHSVF